jgi:hypothetical protein
MTIGACADTPPAPNTADTASTSAMWNFMADSSSVCRIDRQRDPAFANWATGPRLCQSRLRQSLTAASAPDIDADQRGADWAAAPRLADARALSHQSGPCAGMPARTGCVALDPGYGQARGRHVTS